MDDSQFDTLKDQIRSLYYQLRDEVQSRWQRDLPLEELLFDRWERAKNLGFGEESSIYHNSYVYGDVTVGQNTWIGPFTLLDGSGSLTIGDNCDISAGVHIYTHDTVRRVLSQKHLPSDISPTSIGTCCYIGSQTVIAKGVTIGDYVVIGANSFVNKDIPSYSVAGGSPCKIIGKVVIKNNEITLAYNNSNE